MKRVLFTVLWTIAGYVTGAIVIGGLSGMIFSILISLGINLKDHTQLIRLIGMSGVFLITAGFLVVALRGRLPGTRRAPLPP